MGGRGLTGKVAIRDKSSLQVPGGDYIISMPSSPNFTSFTSVAHEYQVGDSGKCFLHWCYTCLSPENCSPLPEHTLNA